MTEQPATRKGRWLCLLLAATTLAVFWPVTGHDFINFDDPDYVTENVQVQRGLTWPGVIWAFRTNHTGNWHPLTWLSHMLDGQLYGLSPRGHHFTSLAIHVANALLLLVILRRVTGELWPSAFVAGLFALHPAHVESVAWVAERKDVLSTFFWMLTLWAYGCYAGKCEAIARGLRSTQHAARNTPFWSPATQSPVLYYSLALVFFALGLMSKPMVVTLPFVLLLLDYWPLRRVAGFDFHAPLTSSRKVLSLIVEKVPFLVMAIACSAVTFHVQRQAGAVGENPLADRIWSAVISHVRYLGKLFWPENMAVFYPRPAEWSMGTAFGAAATLLAVTVLVLWLGRCRPFLPVGWFWYLGTLVPVIGIVQVGEQALADRYTYIPFIGLFIMIAWGVAAMTGSWRERQLLLIGATTAVLAACILCTRAHLRHWQSSESLFAHALAVTKDNAVAHNNLGAVFEEKGNLAEALAHYTEALRIKPNLPDAQVNVGIQLARQGKIEEALGHFYVALALNPNAKVHYNLGNLFVEQGDWIEAVKHLSSALEKQPDFAEARYNLGLALLMQGNSEAAVAHYREAVRLKPDWPAALNELAWILATHPSAEIRNGAEAVNLAARACELTDRKEVHYLSTFDAACAEAGRFEEAIRTAEQVRDLALASGQPALAQAAERRLALYRARTPYRQP